MKIKSHILALSIGFSCISALGSSESLLPTSAANIEAATNAAKSVMVCRLTDLGWLDFRGPSVSAYDEAKFEVITTLKGEPVTKIVCSLLILASPLSANEKAPVVGENYVVIGDNKEGKFRLQKFLAATPDNIAKVQHLLSNSALKVGAPDTSATKALPERSHPGISLPKALEKTPESKATTPTASSPSEEPTSSTAWSIIMVLIVAVCGLLWLLLKRRS